MTENDIFTGHFPTTIDFVTCMATFLLSSWPSLISDVLVIYNLASDWPRTFLQPGYFCLAYTYVIHNDLQFASNTVVLQSKCVCSLILVVGTEL